MNGNAMLKPALMGRAGDGRAVGPPRSSSLGNCCCCAWLVTGGLVAAYVLQSNTPQPITMGDGALVGLLAGLFGAVVNMIISVPMNMLIGPFQQQLIQRFVGFAAGPARQPAPDGRQHGRRAACRSPAPSWRSS